VGDGALQVLTVHQAKGLEFPVVVLWDAVAPMGPSPPKTGAFRVSADGTAWSLRLDGLSSEEPRGVDLGKLEQTFRDAERRRVVYVAATRARELLIIPSAAGKSPEKVICANLLFEAEQALLEVIEPFTDEVHPAWAKRVKPTPAIDVAAPSRKALAKARTAETQLAAEWDAAARASATPHLAPTSVTQLAHEPGVALRAGDDEVIGDVDLEAVPAARPARIGRYGNTFGKVVHQAIGFKLNEPALPAAEAVARAARLAGLDEHLAEAVADVERTVAALRDAGLTSKEGGLSIPSAG
jgi:ATP-dependent helicase/nuclease subunit A